MATAKGQTMNTKQTGGIGAAVTQLLDLAEIKNLKLTTSPIEVFEGVRGETNIRLNACQQNGDDFLLQVFVDADGTLLSERTLVSRWDADADEMTDWLPY